MMNDTETVRYIWSANSTERRKIARACVFSFLFPFATKAITSASRTGENCRLLPGMQTKPFQQIQMARTYLIQATDARGVLGGWGADKCVHKPLDAHGRL
jgi:hypothetical protein